MDLASEHDRNWRNLLSRLEGEGKVLEVPGLLRRSRITGKHFKRSLEY
jgi:hypothetical protein